MQLNLYDLQIIIDTLSSSLQISDGGKLFGYTKEGREQVLHTLLMEIRKKKLDIKLK